MRESACKIVFYHQSDRNGRAYDPLVGQFLSPDPFVSQPQDPDGYNRYAYCRNNPLKYVDPSGYTNYIIDGLEISDFAFSWAMSHSEANYYKDIYYFTGGGFSASTGAQVSHGVLDKMNYANRSDAFNRVSEQLDKAFKNNYLGIRLQEYDKGYALNYSVRWGVGAFRGSDYLTHEEALTMQSMFLLRMNSNQSKFTPAVNNTKLENSGENESSDFWYFHSKGSGNYGPSTDTRIIAPDMISINFSLFSIVGSGKGGIELSLNLITRGKNQGFYFTTTKIENSKGGLINWGLGVNTLWYNGDIPNIVEYLGEGSGSSGGWGYYNGSVNITRNKDGTPLWVGSGYSIFGLTAGGAGYKTKTYLGLMNFDY